MSNAHGWATGPAAALTFNTLGVRLASDYGGPGRDGDELWAVAPRFGDLEHCEGVFVCVCCVCCVCVCVVCMYVCGEEDDATRSI